MRETMLRILRFTTPALLAWALLAIPFPAQADCHICCAGGGGYNGPLDYGSCCALFGTLCGNLGSAYIDSPPFGMYCPNFSSSPLASSSRAVSSVEWLGTGPSGTSSENAEGLESSQP